MALADLSAEELAAFMTAQKSAYNDLKARGLKLDLTRGKPSAQQLDLSNDLLKLPTTHIAADGTDTRNYGGLHGLTEIREIFAELLGVNVDQLVAQGNSSLTLMQQVLVDCLLHGAVDSERPWVAEEKIKFICPVPGYDRHFALLNSFGIGPELNSFPSNTVAVVAALAVILVGSAARRYRTAALVLAVAAGSVVSVLVVAQQWHRPGDVLGAWLVAVGAAAVVRVGQAAWAWTSDVEGSLTGGQTAAHRG